jgi:hypothetical protein
MSDGGEVEERMAKHVVGERHTNHFALGEIASR